MGPCHGTLHFCKMLVNRSMSPYTFVRLQLPNSLKGIFIFILKQFKGFFFPSPHRGIG